MRHRRRGLVAVVTLLWLASIPVTLALATQDAPAETVVAGAAVIRTLPPSVPARVDRMPRVSRAAADPSAFVGRDGERITAHRLARYLSRRGSPMAPHASTILAAGLRYGVDPRVIVAIAGVESYFGDVMPCFNAWGWGPNECRWSSWRQAITSYTRVVAEAYPSLRRGDFVTASRGYNPLNAARWAAKCRAYFSAI